MSGLKLAIAGKGGTGKTTLSGIIARELARRGRRLTAIDADPNPTLALTLGIDMSLMEEAPALPRDLLEIVVDDDGQRAYKLRIPVPEILGSIGLTGPDGVTLIIAGRVEHAARGCNCGTHAAVKAILAAITAAPDEVVLLDMEAGVEHFSRAGGTLAAADLLLLLIEPFYKSMVTGRQLAQLSAELGIPRRFVVANKVRSDEDRAAIDEFCRDTGLELLATVPWDPRLQEAETSAISPIDFDPGSPGVVATLELVDRILEVSEGVAAP